jgi:hypothetical protein
VSLHPNLLLFGNLKLLEVYEFYDVPVLLSCRAPTGTIYLAVAVKDSRDSEDWLYVAMSHDRFVHVRSGGIDLRSAFTAPEDEVTFLVTIPHDENVEATVKALTPPIPEALLPAAGEFLHLDTATLPALDSEEELAVRKRRNMVRVKMKLPEYARSEAPARPLGLFLSGMQEMINSIALSLRGSAARKGAFTREVLSFSELAVLGMGGASFEILVGSTEPPPMFDEVETEATEALEYFMKVLSASGNADQLQAFLSEQPRVAGNLLVMLRAVEKRVEWLDVKWASPFPGRKGEAKMSGVAIKAAIAVIEHKAPEKQTRFWRLGRLIGASIERKVFEFKSLEQEDEHYEGKVSDEAMDAIDGAVLGGTYRAHILYVVALKPATAEEVKEFTLLALKAPG